ncbi:sulfatase [Fictibacillus phosphorivorans]|uniref:sulfatase n=1 Tax=Fictibacillus phosphorivorans TaxID=1221500 RepID=UPI00203D62F9|nr:sulfatase [Fictibacillus phosphorivorans]MCM3717627.1 sulfatase [Fictibacillus phosphorivorans]MCM3775527.1 sulfatase [Fictibacillus phosphorivorans]
MKAIMVMFDSLNRHMLPPYGFEDIHAPNFKRLQEKTVTFDQSWVGSMPCMPARRELHTGRYNFLHRSWGPLEPFDDSMPELLKNNGIYTHLITDHQHYWEDGGYNYHTRYNSFEFSRGQEGDTWKGAAKVNHIPLFIGGHDLQRVNEHDWVNRKLMDKEENFPQAKTFQAGLEFIDQYYDEDNWFLQIETFDPHEPFYAPENFRKVYKHEYNGPHFDWPKYGPVKETAEQVEHCGLEYKALVSMCDAYLGKVLDKMDALDLWEDTMLIVNTDHGFLLGEHDYWGKCVQPFYNEVARTPLFIWDPRSKRRGERSDCLVQMIDIPPTLLDFFNVEIPKDMQGKPLRETIQSNRPVRETLLFGIHGGHVNCTDGRYVYMRGTSEDNSQTLYHYTLMPAHLRRFFTVEELKTLTLSQPFSFTKELQTMKIESIFNERSILDRSKTMLFDLNQDPLQQNPIQDPQIEEKMIQYLIDLMEESDAPIEQYERLGLRVPLNNV